MKLLITLILFFCLSLAGIGQQYPDSGFTNKAEAKNLIVNGKKEGKWVEYIDIYKDVLPDTHLAVGYRLTVYKAGKPNGIQREYEYFYVGDERKVYKLTRESQYSMGVKNGVEKLYYRDSFDTTAGIQFEIPYKYGVKNGVQKDYYEHGKVQYEHPYTAGKKNGIERWYYGTGNIMAEITYSYDKKIKTKVFSENGIEFNTKGRKPEAYIGFTTKKEADGDFVNGVAEGKMCNYYCSIDGIPNDSCLGFHSLTYYEKGKPVGIIRMLNNDGSLYGVFYYDDTTHRAIRKEYYKDGKLKKEIPYDIHDYYKDGLMKEYYEDGKLKIETPLIQGQRNGMVKEYDENGKIKSNTAYTLDHKRDSSFVGYSKIDTRYSLIIGIWKQVGDSTENVWYFDEYGVANIAPEENYQFMDFTAIYRSGVVSASYKLDAQGYEQYQIKDSICNLFDNKTENLKWLLIGSGLPNGDKLPYIQFRYIIKVLDKDNLELIFVDGKGLGKTKKFKKVSDDSNGIKSK
jgi:antitoxin component YwqK of YwqJK toxin-antitoxin module